MVAERRGWDWVMKRDYPRFKEDYFLESNKNPIFAVADGVTLSVNPGEKYPLPSGAGKAAKIFCEEAVKEGERLYNSFSESDIAEIFDLANKAVGNFNEEKGLTKKKINYWDVDYYSVTSAFALSKGNKFYWGSICDSQVVQFDKRGKLKFISNDGWSYLEKSKPGWDQLPMRKRMTYIHKTFRNILDKNGLTNGYGVISGEKNALKYVNLGSLNASKGDIFLIFTDGFSPYIKEKFFIDLFRKWPSNLEERFESAVSDFAKSREPKNKEDLYKFLYDYAAERTLIAVSI